jgi:SAM-dependent methyltransferase
MVARYDAVAEFYADGWADQIQDPATSALLDLVCDVRGASVVDIACGHGRVSRALARRGAQVLGIDLSAALIDRAKAIESDEPLGIEYRVGDATSPAALDGCTFDAACCSMALSDIDDLDGVVATVARILERGAPFVVSLLHPCFAGGDEVSGSWPTTKTYYDEEWWSADGNASTLRKRVGANHRMLSTYLNAFVRFGFAVDECREPPPPEDWTSRNPLAATRPVFLVARFLKR